MLGAPLGDAKREIAKVEWNYFKDTVFLILGVAGTALGILNYCRSVAKDRVRLLVEPLGAKAINHGNALAIQPLSRDPEQKIFAIRVTNLSSFEVTVREVGLTIAGSEHRSPILPHVRVVSSEPVLPHKLAARTQFTVYMNKDRLNPDDEYHSAYAKSDCGRLFKRRIRLSRESD